MKQNKRKAKDIIINILIVILFIIAIGSAAYIVRYYINSMKTEKEFDELKEYIVEDDSSEANDKPKYTKTKDNYYILVRYEKLHEMNSDFIGWIKIDGTSIDYPVMHTPDNPEYYLHTSFDKEYSSAGTLFVDSKCSLYDNISDNVIIYGHNMKSGTMFHDLISFENEEFYKNHKYITFDTIYEPGTYEVIAAMRTQVYAKDDISHYHYYEFINAKNEEEFDEFVSYAKNNTPYNIDTTANYGDKLITLSTCAYHNENGRYVVIAKKVK